MDPQPEIRDQKETSAMQIVVHHQVTDREKFLATDPQDIAGNAPPGARVRHFLPARDGSAADCLWESDSLDALRDYLDPATRGISQNTYFEVDSEAVVVFEEPASANA